jgi:hypothetical protein
MNTIRFSILLPILSFRNFLRLYFANDIFRSLAINWRQKVMMSICNTSIVLYRKWHPPSKKYPAISMLDVGPAYCESNRRISYSALVCRSAQVCLILIGFFLGGGGVVVLLLFSSFPFISSFSIFSGGLALDSFLVLSYSPSSLY